MKPALYCRATMTLVEQNRMRPGYDCRCSGCRAYVESQPPKKEPESVGLEGLYAVPWGSG